MAKSEHWEYLVGFINLEIAHAPNLTSLNLQAADTWLAAGRATKATFGQFCWGAECPVGVE